MSYTINLTSGAKLTDVIDGSVDQSATDLTLIGRNISNYGTFLNDNFVYLLENFASPTEPPRPITGQLWYDTSVGVLKVYNNRGFTPTGNTIVSSSQPSSLSAGTLWIDSNNKQLKFYDGVDLLTAGPIYTSSQGSSGFVVTDIIDTFQQNHTIVELRVADVLIGIFSKDTFTPLNAIDGFSGSIAPGFNVAADASLTFNMTVSQALGLVDSNGDLQTTDSFMSKISDTFARGTVSLLNDIPVKLGSGQELQVEVDAVLTQFKSTKVGQNLQFTTRKSNVLYEPALFINSDTSQVGIFTDAPTHTLDVNGDVRIRGDMIVEGATTTINTTNLAVEDFLIELGKVDTPSDTTANNGGISLAGTTAKTFVWKQSNAAWVSSESIDLAPGRVYKIGGSEVLSFNSLGSSVHTASGLVEVGALTRLTAGYLSVDNNIISYSYTGATNGNIVLEPKGTGTVDVSNAKITRVAYPAAGTDAANADYANDVAYSAPLGISLNVGAIAYDSSGFATIATNFLNKIFPATERREGTILRAMCTNTTPETIFIEYVQTGGVWLYSLTIA